MRSHERKKESKKRLEGGGFEKRDQAGVVRKTQGVLRDQYPKLGWEGSSPWERIFVMKERYIIRG